MTEPLEPDMTLADIKLDHETVEDERELDIVATEIALYLRRGEFAAVKAFFVVQELADIASLLEQMEPEDALLAMRQLDRQDQAEVFDYLRPSAQVDLAEKMSREELAIPGARIEVLAGVGHELPARILLLIEARIVGFLAALPA